MAELSDKGLEDTGVYGKVDELDEIIHVELTLE